MKTITAKCQSEVANNRFRSKEYAKAPLKELRDIMNKTKAKMPLGEISHLCDIGSLIPRTTTGFMATRHQNLIPEGPHKVLVKRDRSSKKENSFENTKNSEENSKSLLLNQRNSALKKKNLSIRVTDNSPKNQPIKLVQFKSLSTKHANGPKVDPLQPAASISIPNYEPAKCSLKRNGIVAAYAANTNQGLVR
jgi:hypothetical protein